MQYILSLFFLHQYGPNWHSFILYQDIQFGDTINSYNKHFAIDGDCGSSGGWEGHVPRATMILGRDSIFLL